ncbi:hypothetical protein GF362_07185 [Candidatus Dojkabacteria bacterium]|nr:hypothetical protein [Candidatus Dojkabacteria bacterium]
MSKQFDFIGSIYSRNPNNGENEIFGYLYSLNDFSVLEYSELPNKIKKELKKNLKDLEKKYKFVVECIISYDKENKKYIIEFSKEAKLEASVFPQVLNELYKSGIIEKDELFQKIPLDFIHEWLASTVKKKKTTISIAEGNPVTYGGVVGELVSKRKDLEDNFLQNKSSIWVLSEVFQEDLAYFHKTDGLVLTQSGPTSHAAVIAKGLGIPCILGCSNILDSEYIGRTVTLDANRGRIYKGKQEIVSAKTSKYFDELLLIATKSLEFEILANADTLDDSKQAQGFHINGIGLCRTEHMFIGKEGRKIIRKILFDNNSDQELTRRFIKKHTNDFYKLFKSQSGNKVVVRYLDAPLHEFTEKNCVVEGKFCETNPMLGYRGARFLVLNPDLISIQTQAIFKALEKLEKQGKKIEIILEIPLIVDPEEIFLFKSIIKEEINKNENWQNIKYKIGSMIETPRAGLLIKDIAPLVDFISFGTNDLTQTLFGISRDDSETFMSNYISQGIFKNDPFATLDIKGLGVFIKDIVDKAKKVNEEIHISICGEQAADPLSLKFLIESGIDSISSSPARLPYAILASAKYSCK